MRFRIFSIGCVVALVLGAVGGCSGSSDATVKCHYTEVDGAEYCTYRDPITETGYDCPQRLPNPKPVGGGTACTDRDEIPEDHKTELEERIEEGEWETDDPDDGPSQNPDPKCKSDADCDSGKKCTKGSCIAKRTEDCFEVFGDAVSANNDEPADHQSPSTLQFGTVNVGESQVQSIRFYNFGCQNNPEQTEVLAPKWVVDGERQDEAPEGFELSNYPTEGETITGGSRPSVDVTFSPTEPIQYGAALLFRTVGGYHRINLMGTGADTPPPAETILCKPADDCICSTNADCSAQGKHSTCLEGRCVNPANAFRLRLRWRPTDAFVQRLNLVVIGPDGETYSPSSNSSYFARTTAAGSSSEFDRFLFALPNSEVKAGTYEIRTRLEQRGDESVSVQYRLSGYHNRDRLFRETGTFPSQTDLTPDVQTYQTRLRARSGTSSGVGLETCHSNSDCPKTRAPASMESACRLTLPSSQRLIRTTAIRQIST